MDCNNPSSKRKRIGEEKGADNNIKKLKLQQPTSTDITMDCNKRKRISDEIATGNIIIKKPKWQLPSALANWASTYPTTTALSLTALLKILQDFGFPDLPGDARTLLDTPRQSSNLIRNVEPGQYIHIGIEEGVKYTLRENGIDVSQLHFLVIDYNTDGVQMSDSTTNVFWPIWCRIRIPFIGKPFLAGNSYSCSGEPKNANEFMLEFVSEFKRLIINGLKINSKKTLQIRAGRFLGDTPGRCGMLGLKGPTGYCGCSRCTTNGIHKNNRVCFPELNAPLRTDQNFKDRSQSEHHHFLSLLEKDLKLPCITQAPLDGMHVVYAGFAKRVVFWLNTDSVNYKFRLSSAQIDAVNEILEAATLTRPIEFARPVKDLRRYKKWKCTQLRQFLLYLSIVALKNVLSTFQYEHLLLAIIGIRILSDEKLFKRHNDIAKSMLLEYVQILKTNFGKFRLIYCVHNLIHLANETLMQNEPLDRFSMWEFETANSSLKQFTKRQGVYLQQCYNRTMEKYQRRFETESYLPKYPMCKLLLESEYDREKKITRTIFSRIVFQKFMLDASPGNRWFLTSSGNIWQFERAIIISDKRNSDKIKVQGRVFKKKCNYFENPLSSSFLHIYQCNEKYLSNLFEIDITYVMSKMFMIKVGEALIFIPLL